MKNLSFLFAAILFWSCSDDPFKTTIAGNSKTLAGQTIYLKKYSHLDYMEEYMLDSTVVDSEGNFAFSLLNTEPALVTIDNRQRPPGTYMVLRDRPDHYYYSFCEKFFGFDPLFYVEQGKNYNIAHWNEKKDEVTYGDDRHNVLRDYYKSINFRKFVDEQSASGQQDPEKVWGQVSAHRDSILTKLNFAQDLRNKSFENYLRTEIELGAINEFLAWNYRENPNPMEEEQLEQILEAYNNRNWNPNSIELYKLTEWYISHQMNKQNGKNLYYYEPSTEKIAMAEKYANPRIREKFVRNLEVLMERKEGTEMAENNLNKN
ncbi:hypothetical protein [Salinimicrobium xinjiangense]|uniref:hypothetical protein n=1 Tax=Salinimicrobium xinjiangense TaxID=438596 RepID=UPI000411C648|nr:hypothetical protein [Salinimicrobium xinjiangense]